MPQFAVAAGKVITAPLVSVAGVTLGSVPTDAEEAGHAEKPIESVPPTPAPAAFWDMTTVVPVVERTVVPAGIAEGVVISRIVIPATIQDGVEAKCRVALPLAVVPLVVAVPATWTRAYEPPETSVPPVPAFEVGAVVNRAKKTAGNAGIATWPVTQFSSACAV